MFDWRHELVDHRSRVLQVDPVDLPPAAEGGEGLQEGGGGQLVPERQDRARQRAGHRRPLRALRHAWSSSGSWSSGSSGSPSTPTGCWPIWTTGKMDWSESTTTAQRNWIGRSEGAELDFPIGGPADRRTDGRRDEWAAIRVFTTRPDTVFGATFMVLAPEHPLVDALTTPEQRRGGRGLPRGGSVARTWSPARWASGRRPASSPAATRSTRRPASRSRSGSPTTC